MSATSPAPFEPGPRLIDGTKLNEQLAWPTASLEAAATATGTTITDAFELKAAITQFTTVAASTGAVLPDLDVGQSAIIYNDGASALTVYAPGGATIDGTAGATGVALANAKRCQYTRISATKWLSAQLGAVSA